MPSQTVVTQPYLMVPRPLNRRWVPLWLLGCAIPSLACGQVVQAPLPEPQESPVPAVREAEQPGPPLGVYDQSILQAAARYAPALRRRLPQLASPLDPIQAQTAQFAPAPASRLPGPAPAVVAEGVASDDMAPLPPGEPKKKRVIRSRMIEALLSALEEAEFSEVPGADYDKADLQQILEEADPILAQSTGPALRRQIERANQLPPAFIVRPGSLPARQIFRERFDPSIHRRGTNVPSPARQEAEISNPATIEAVPAGSPTVDPALPAAAEEETTGPEKE